MNDNLVKFALQHCWVNRDVALAIQQHLTDEFRINRGITENFLLDNAKYLTKDYRKSRA